MDHRNVTWHARRTHCRGAVFLLSIYCASLLLLVLSGVALQRTFTDTRASQQSSALQQAFYQADGAMDYALAKVRRYYLYDGVCYSAVPTAGRPAICDPTSGAQGPSFTLATTSGEVMTREKQQELTRRITANGVAGESAARGTSVISASVQENGPLEGMWANRLAVIYGGGHYGSQVGTYLRGNLRSNRGVLGAIFADAYDPTAYNENTIIMGKTTIMSGAAMAENWGDLTHPSNPYVSPELLAVKERYLHDNNAWDEHRGPINYMGIHYPGITYITDGQHQETFPHVEGGASIGTSLPIEPLGQPADISPSDCNGNLELTSGKTRVSDGFEADNGKVRDLSPDPNFIVLCVNAIYPADQQGWSDLINNRPPQLAFEKPATVYITGSKHISSNDVDFFTGSMIEGWDFAVGAEIWSPTDAANKPLTDSVQLSVTEQAAGKRSVVWVKPGKFSGSIFAPESLVFLGERDAQARSAADVPVPLHLQYLVGDEVIVGLAYDELRLGASDSDGTKPPSEATTFLGGWMNHSASQ